MSEPGAGARKPSPWHPQELVQGGGLGGGGEGCSCHDNGGRSGGRRRREANWLAGGRACAHPRREAGRGSWNRRETEAREMPIYPRLWGPFKTMTCILHDAGTLEGTSRSNRLAHGIPGGLSRRGQGFLSTMTQSSGIPRLVLGFILIRLPDD